MRQANTENWVEHTIYIVLDNLLITGQTTKIRAIYSGGKLPVRWYIITSQFIYLLVVDASTWYFNRSLFTPSVREIYRYLYILSLLYYYISCGVQDKIKE
jgi:hypothetical protein